MTHVYADAEQFEAVFTTLFEEIAGSRELDDLVRRRMVVSFHVRDPDVEMWVDGSSAPATMTFGPSTLRPTLALDLTADSLHELLLGTLPLGKAMSSGRLGVKGSKLKAIRLQGLFHAFQSAYPALAEERLGDT
jgi:hypothetical protein